MMHVIKLLPVALLAANLLPAASSGAQVLAEDGRTLPSVFSGLAPVPKEAVMRGALKFQPAKGGCKSTPPRLASIFNRITSLFSLPVVHAASPIECPPCDWPSGCVGFYMYGYVIECAQGCPGQYERFMSYSALASPYDGYCPSGTTVCGTCEQCGERKCYNG